MGYTSILITVLVGYLVLNLAIGIYYGKKQSQIDMKQGKSFVSDYFIGGRSMGGLVLAMTLVATFTSASSFIGGPGVAFSRGLVWVYLSMIQVPTAFIILAVLGKRFAIIARKTGAVTVTDYLNYRYQSKAVVILSTVCLVLFFVAQMVSQFVGGAVLFQTITGLPYIYGLACFGLVVIIYTSIGGFKAVVTTDTLQGIIMLVGSVIILVTVVKTAGGIEPLVTKLNAVNPGWDKIEGAVPTSKAFVMSFWVLVGIGVLGLPQTAVRAMGYKDTKALHKAMIYGSLTVGALMLLMHISGVFAPAILDPATVENTDYVIPTIVLKYMNPVVAGLFIAAPLAAVMSTVSSLLILSSAAIVKDLYLNYIAKPEVVDVCKANRRFLDKERADSEAAEERKIKIISLISTLLLGLLVFALAIAPPDLIVWINLFALGGLECAFFAPIVIGLFWAGGNKVGAIASSIIGVTSFLIISNLKISVMGTTPIVPSMALSILTYFIGSKLGQNKLKENKLR